MEIIAVQPYYITPFSPLQQEKANRFYIYASGMIFLMIPPMQYSCSHHHKKKRKGHDPSVKRKNFLFHSFEFF